MAGPAKPAPIAAPSIDRVAQLGLVVSDLAAAEAFFTEAFGAAILERKAGSAARATLMGVPGAAFRQTVVALGEERVALLCFEQPGRRYPAESTSTDLWFQHFAIIVSDMAAAHARLVAAGRFVPISLGGPVQLPPSSGGVQAFKFRDRDGHPLELLAFPPGSGPQVWQEKRAGALILGIDHSAISVGDTAASTAFFENGFGLTQSMQSENVGPEQSRMDAVADARVTVTGLAPRRAPPHVELLGYHVGARRPIAAGTRADDLAATFFELHTGDLEPLVGALRAHGATFVSPGVVDLEDGTRAIAVLDPDGHRFIVVETA